VTVKLRYERGMYLGEGKDTTEGNKKIEIYAPR
jgi:hypothetical protein